MAQTATLKLTDTQFLLEQWAKWVLSGGVASIGYPSIQPFRQLLGSSVKGITITDDEALLIDATVARLKKRDPEMGKIVVTYYLSSAGGMGVVKLAQHLKMPEKRVRILLEAGTAWVDGALDLNPCQN